MLRNQENADKEKFATEAHDDPERELMVYIGSTRRSFRTSTQREMHWVLMWPAWLKTDQLPENGTDVPPEEQGTWRVLEAQKTKVLRETGATMQFNSPSPPETFVYRYSLKRMGVHASLRDISLQEVGLMDLDGRQKLEDFAAS